MGYEVSIQREKNQSKILVEELMNYLDSDSEFEIIEELSVQLDDRNTMTVPIPNSGLWKIGRGIPFIFQEEYGWISIKKS